MDIVVRAENKKHLPTPRPRPSDLKSFKAIFGLMRAPTFESQASNAFVVAWNSSASISKKMYVGVVGGREMRRSGSVIESLRQWIKSRTILTGPEKLVPPNTAKKKKVRRLF
jgi:hypothetical protein